MAWRKKLPIVQNVMNIRASILRGMFRLGVIIVEFWMNWRIKDNIKIRKENMHERLALQQDFDWLVHLTKENVLTKFNNM